MSGSLLLLPLDDRPINLAYPPLLAAVAGETLLTPPSATLGHFLTPGDSEALAEWLARMAPASRTAIVSLDMLAYGGLVASRTPAVTVDQALRRLDVLRAMKRHNPALRVYAFNVIMRLTITGTDAETRDAWRNIFRYSVLRDQAERLGDAGAARELADVTAHIPPRLLQAYLDARARNHAVNRAAIDLLADGVIDFLALVQEDTAPAGLHVVEQQALTAAARSRTTDARWRLYAGTDEAALTLLGRALLDEAGLQLPASLRLRDPDTAAFPPLFEDRPLREAAARHLDAAGGIDAPDGLPVAIHTFTPPQPDLFDMPPLPEASWECALQAFPVSATQRWLTGLGNGPLAVADVAYCNGGDPHLLDALLADGRYWTLEAYAGWNTAGNTLGTTFAHAAVRHCARARGLTAAMEAAHERALRVRLLDDVLYQSIVRAAAIAHTEEFGASPLNLMEAAPVLEAWVDDAMHRAWNELRARYPIPDRHAAFRARLPWGRLFEVGIEFADAEG